MVPIWVQNLYNSILLICKLYSSIQSFFLFCVSFKNNKSEQNNCMSTLVLKVIMNVPLQSVTLGLKNKQLLIQYFILDRFSQGQKWSSCARLCFKKNWRQPSALNLWNPKSPAYVYYAETKINLSRCPGAIVRHQGQVSTALLWDLLRKCLSEKMDLSLLSINNYNQCMVLPYTRALLTIPTTQAVKCFIARRLTPGCSYRRWFNKI